MRWEAWSFGCVTSARALAVSLLLTEFGLSPAIAVAFEEKDFGMVGQAVDQGDGARGIGETVSQRLKGRLVVISSERCS